jgi:hypothetical protein
VRLSDTLARVAIGQCYYPGTEQCCIGPSSYDGLPTAWICPNYKKCGQEGVQLCICDNPCGFDDCCQPPEVCVTPSWAGDDSDRFCGPKCPQDNYCEGNGDALGTCCDPDEQLCCGDGCCSDGKSCCDNEGPNPWCCDEIDGYVCGSTDLECGCSRGQRCGDECCPRGQACFGRGEFVYCAGPRERLRDLLDLLKQGLRDAADAALPTMAAAGAGASSRGSLAEVAAVRGSADALVAVAAVENLARLAHHRLLLSRPDSAYRRPVRVATPRLRRLAPGPGLDPSAARALHRLLAAEARAWALVNAMALARARSLGAIRARNMAAARRQARAAGQFSGQAAKALRQLPSMSRKAAAALRAAGAPEVTVTGRQARDFRESVRNGGLPADLRARLSQLGLTRSDQRQVLKLVLANRLRTGPVLIAPLADASRLAALRRSARVLGQTATRSRTRPLVRSKGRPSTVPGIRPHASQSAQRARRGSR